MSVDLTPEQRVTWAKGRACDLVTVVRDEPREGIEAWLARYDRADLDSIVTVLACMVPDDRPISELLAWIDGPKVQLHTAAPPKRTRPTKAELVGRATRPRRESDVDEPVPHDYPLTPQQRLRLEAQDARLRHCTACQEWAYGSEPCAACGAPLAALVVAS